MASAEEGTRDAHLASARLKKMKAMWADFRDTALVAAGAVGQSNAGQAEAMIARIQGIDSLLAGRDD